MYAPPLFRFPLRSLQLVLYAVLPFSFLSFVPFVFTQGFSVICVSSW